MRAFDRRVHGERMGQRVQRRERVDVQGHQSFLVTPADQVVEHSGLRDRELLIEQPRLARIDRRAERGPLTRLRQLRERHEKAGVELAHGPQLAPFRQQRDPQPGKGIEILGAPLRPRPAGGSEDEDGTRPLAPALRHGFERLRRELDEDVFRKGPGQQNVPDEQQRLRVPVEPGFEDLALGQVEAVEVDQSEPWAREPFKRRAAADARSRTGRAGGRARSGSHGEYPRPGRCDVQGNHGDLVRCRTFHEAKKS